MDQETITRFVNRIISKEPEEAIRYSLLQYEVLCDNDGSFDDYFRQLSSDNFIYAAFIYHCFKQENNFKSSSVEDILLSRLKEFNNQHGGSTIDVNQGVESRDDRNNPSAPLFITLNGTPCNRQQLYYSLRNRQKKVTGGDEMQFGCHAFRHTFVSSVEKIGGGAVARDLANHKSLTITNRYDHSTAGQRRSAVDALRYGL